MTTYSSSRMSVGRTHVVSVTAVAYLAFFFSVIMILNEKIAHNDRNIHDDQNHSKKQTVWEKRRIHKHNNRLRFHSRADQASHDSLIQHIQNHHKNQDHSSLLSSDVNGVTPSISIDEMEQFEFAHLQPNEQLLSDLESKHISLKSILQSECFPHLSAQFQKEIDDWDTFQTKLTKSVDASLHYFLQGNDLVSGSHHFGFTVEGRLVFFSPVIGGSFTFGGNPLNGTVLHSSNQKWWKSHRLKWTESCPFIDQLLSYAKVHTKHRPLWKYSDGSIEEHPNERWKFYVSRQSGHHRSDYSINDPKMKTTFEFRNDRELIKGVYLLFESECDHQFWTRLSQSLNRLTRFFQSFATEMRDQLDRQFIADVMGQREPHLLPHHKHARDQNHPVNGDLWVISELSGSMVRMSESPQNQYTLQCEALEYLCEHTTHLDRSITNETIQETLVDLLRADDADA